MEIRALKECELKEAVALRIISWTEELVGKAENNLTEAEEMAFWSNWMQSAEANNDVRLLLGAFDGDTLVGAAFASFADEEDIPENGIELNGLWVYPAYRNRGLSLQMLTQIIRYYQALGKTQMVAYNHHDCESNAFYRKFGGTVEKQLYQLEGKLLIDVFVLPLEEMKTKIVQSLERYL